MTVIRWSTGTPTNGCIEVFVDRGYRGHGEEGSSVYISGQKRGIKTLD